MLLLKSELRIGQNSPNSLNENKIVESIAHVHVLRLRPHEDLKMCLLLWAKKHQVKAAVVISCVGSLEQFHLRYANQSSGDRKKGFFEILSLTGTISDTYAHLHLSLADEQGIAKGGHLLDGNLIYTTAEIAIAELTDMVFAREKDPVYGYDELNVQKKP